jgi:hypothetical protein
MRIRKLLYIILFIAASVNSYSQYWEVGLLLGTSTYSGDLIDGAFSFKEFHPATGALVRYNFNPWLTFKADIYYGTISGNDKNSKSDDRKLRNLSFKSEVLDIGFQAELNLTGYKSGHPIYKSSPYLLFGAAVYRFNPKTQYHYTAASTDPKLYNQSLANLEGDWVALQPLCTEGQGTTKYNDREKYNLTQISIPLGVGWKIALSRFWNFGIEVGARATFTDYLDDVSMTYVERDVLLAAYGEMSYNMSNRTGETGLPMDYTSQDERGDPTKKDWYYFAGITLTYSILPNKCYKF